jgi:hypothetical protein
MQGLTQHDYKYDFSINLLVQKLLIKLTLVYRLGILNLSFVTFVTFLFSNASNLFVTKASLYSRF